MSDKVDDVQAMVRNYYDNKIVDWIENNKQQAWEIIRAVHYRELTKPPCPHKTIRQAIAAAMESDYEN